MVCFSSSGINPAYLAEDPNEDTIGVLVRLITEKKGEGEAPHPKTGLSGPRPVCSTSLKVSCGFLALCLLAGLPAPLVLALRGRVVEAEPRDLYWPRAPCLSLANTVAPHRECCSAGGAAEGPSQQTAAVRQ